MANKLLAYAESLYPDAQTELANWQTPFQFLVCVMLSAQATDKQVNKVTTELFKRWSTAEELASADIEEIEQIIKSINYYHSKAKHIKKSAQIIARNGESKLGYDLKQLVQLPGVGYKTANVFINVIYPDKCQGIAVDTHVDRVAKRFGLIDDKKMPPDKVAKELEKIYDKKDWGKVNSTLVLFGRYHCTARSPKCYDCGIKNKCMINIKKS